MLRPVNAYRPERVRRRRDPAGQRALRSQRRAHIGNLAYAGLQTFKATAQIRHEDATRGARTLVAALPHHVFVREHRPRVSSRQSARQQHPRPIRQVPRDASARPAPNEASSVTLSSATHECRDTATCKVVASGRRRSLQARPFASAPGKSSSCEVACRVHQNGYAAYLCSAHGIAHDAARAVSQ
jgi:hypothetical protein